MLNYINSIIKRFTSDNLVDKYTKALHKGDVDTCIACVRSGTRDQIDKMQKVWNEKYHE